MRVRMIPLVAVVLATAACASAPEPDPGPSPEQQLIDDLRSEVSEVARLQEEADHRLNQVLEVLRSVDEAVADLERVDTFDDQLAVYDAVHDAVVGARVDVLRDGFLALADAVDDARDLLAGTRAHLDDDEWAIAYLDAQDVVLVAVRVHAETADRLAQVIATHWDTYVEVDNRIADFAPRRSRFRDVAEARDGLAVELDTVIRQLVRAEVDIADHARARTRAAQDVNDATADALTVYDQRPAGASGRPAR